MALLDESNGRGGHGIIISLAWLLVIVGVSKMIITGYFEAGLFTLYKDHLVAIIWQNDLSLWSGSKQAALVVVVVVLLVAFVVLVVE